MNILRILCMHTMDLDRIHIYPHLSDPLVSTPLNFGSFFSSLVTHWFNCTTHIFMGVEPCAETC